jgi:acetylornithine deacetylase/succinyl-diaminopimelate desuccinylase-like protein
VRATTTVTNTPISPAGSPSSSSNTVNVTSCSSSPRALQSPNPAVTTETLTSSSGGSSGSLADVAAYYYLTDLRAAGSTGALGTDVGTDNNVPSGGSGVEDDSARHQHMTTFTMGLGLAGTLNVIGIHSGGTMILVPEVADVWIDRHILPGETLAHARHQIETVLKEVVRHSTWELFVDERPTPAPGPYIVPESSSLVQAMRTAIAIEYDSPVTLVLGRSVADTSHIAFHGGIPTVICGPQGGNTCEANEWLDLPSLLPTARAMTRGMVSLMSSPYRTE